MRKLLSLVLVAGMVLSLCACTVKNPAAAKKVFRVGYAREDITPTYSVPLAGYGNTSQRMSQGILSYLYTTCIAITDADDSTILLFTSDIISMRESVVADLRSAVSSATGIAADRIMFTNTHTHSGPDLNNSDSSILKFKTELSAKAVKAAEAALADRSPATIETGTGHTDRLNFVRHYTTTAGEIFGDNLSLNGTLTGHVSEPDNEIQIICFRRAAQDKKDIVAVNWQAHPKLDSAGNTVEGKANRPMLSSDYVGAVRDYMEGNVDCLFAFYQGAAGNLNANSQITSENVSTDCKTYSVALLTSIIDGLENMTPAESTDYKITVATKKFEATLDHTEDHLVPEATKISELWAATNDFNLSLTAAPDSGIQSPYHANSILSRSRNTAYTREMEINAIRVGPLGFVTAPYEMFDVSGIAIKDGSPFETTFVMTCANGSNNYIAAEYAFQGRGTYEAHNRAFVRGTAESLVESFVEMLNSLA